MSQPEAQDTPRGESVAEDYSQLSEEEIDLLLKQDAGVVPAPEPEEEPGEEAPPEPPAEEEPPVEAKDEEVPEKPPEEAEPDLNDELQAALREEMEARNKKLEAQLGRLSGLQGYVERKFKELETRPALRQNGDYAAPDESMEPAPSQPEPQSQAVPRTDPLAVWAIQKAQTEAAQQFQAEHSDMDDFRDGITTYLQESGYDASKLLEANDPIWAQQEVTRVLNEAYWHAKSAARTVRRQELETRRAEQLGELAERKKKAVVSGSGGTPPPAPKPKTYDEMSLEEVEKLLDEETAHLR